MQYNASLHYLFDVDIRNNTKYANYIKVALLTYIYIFKKTRSPKYFSNFREKIEDKCVTSEHT